MGSITAENMNVTGQTVFDSLQVNNKIKIGNSIVIENTDLNNIYTTATSGHLYLQSLDNIDDQYTIINANNKGKVGIGTDNPHEKLQIGNEFVLHDGETKRIGRNVYWDGTQDKRINDGSASALNFDTHAISLLTAEEGMSESSIDWINALVIISL